MTKTEKIKFCIESNATLGNNDSGFEHKSEPELDEFVAWYQSIFAEDEIEGVL